MKKKKYDDFESIDDYFEEEGDAFLLNQTIESDLSDVSYEDFNKANHVVVEDDDDDDYEAETTKTVTKKTTTVKKKETSNKETYENDLFIDFLTFFWTWFRRIGIVIAVILVAYFLTEGLFKDLFLYLLLLIAAFFFGYGFMAVINMVVDNR